LEKEEEEEKKEEICENDIFITKYVKMTALNMGNNHTGLQTVGSGFQVGVSQISRATRIVKFFCIC